MNFKKLIVKNIKLIIIICLIMLLLSNKVSENFTTTQALDAVKSTETKVNSIISEVDTDSVTFGKNLGLEEKKIFFKKAGDNNHSLGYQPKDQVIDIRGYKGVDIWSTEPNDKRNIEIRRGKVKINDILHVNGEVQLKKRLCIDGVCIDKDHLKVLTGEKYFSIQSGRAKKNLNGSTSNAKFENDKNDSMSAQRIISIRDK